MDEKTVEASLATLPNSVLELTNKWNSINSSRTSGLLPLCEQGPLDDAVRNGVWEPELQVKMPTMGGLPGSRGKRIEWPHGNGVSHVKKLDINNTRPKERSQAKQEEEEPNCALPKEKEEHNQNSGKPNFEFQLRPPKWQSHQTQKGQNILQEGQLAGTAGEPSGVEQGLSLCPHIIHTVQLSS